MSRGGEGSRPDLEWGGLALWVHHLDTSWWSVRAHCGARGASVDVTGEVLHAPSVVAWLPQAEAVLSGDRLKAALTNPEPELHWRLERPRGSSPPAFVLTVELSPDPGRQSHLFRFALEEAPCREALQALRVLLARGEEEQV